MKPTILITGGAGYIGSHTALLMAQKGFNVIILDSFVHNQHFNPTWAQVIAKDFADKQTLHEIFTKNNVHAVMHFAAFIEVGLSVKDPMRFYENNVSKTLILLQTMLEHHVTRFIFSSSCAVYGIPQTLPLTEDHPKNPISPYGKTKLMVENMLEDFHQAYGLNYVALRYFNAAGIMPGSGLKENHEPETHLIPLLLRALKENKPFYIYGLDYPTPDGTCIRDFLHVWDIANAHYLALENLSKEGHSGCYNLGTGNGYSVSQIIQAAQKATGKEAKKVVTQRRPGDPAFLVADPKKAAQELGWHPQYSDLEYIVQTALESEFEGYSSPQATLTL